MVRIPNPSESSSNWCRLEKVTEYQRKENDSEPPPDFSSHELNPGGKHVQNPEGKPHWWSWWVRGPKKTSVHANTGIHNRVRFSFDILMIKIDLKTSPIIIHNIASPEN